MEHLLGCHGEWLYIAQAAATLPLVGAWLRAFVLPYAQLRRHDHGTTPADPA